MKSENVTIHEVSDGYQVQIVLGDNKIKYRHYKTLAGAEKYKKKIVTWGGVRSPGEGKKIGRPICPDKKKKVSFSLEPEIFDYIESYCKKASLSRSAFIEFLVYNHRDYK